VLASVSVVTRMRTLALVAGAIGGVAALYGVGVAAAAF
jgi:phage shock protein PspC (stress-responsive transcriptional regulator)